MLFINNAVNQIVEKYPLLFNAFIIMPKYQ